MSRESHAGFEAAFCSSGSDASGSSSEGAGTSTHVVEVMTVVTPFSRVSVRVATTGLEVEDRSSVVVVCSSEVVVEDVGSAVVVVDSSVKFLC